MIIRRPSLASVARVILSHRPSVCLGSRTLYRRGSSEHARGMRLGAVVCSVVVVAFLAMPSASGGEASVYSGIGTWVDLFASNAWDHPETVVASLRRDGVQTLYLETSNYSRPEAIVDPAAVGRFVDAAHAAGIQVVAWYLPAFASPVRDLSRALAAIRFRSPSGERFDSFAL